MNLLHVAAIGVALILIGGVVLLASSRRARR